MKSRRKRVILAILAGILIVFGGVKAGSGLGAAAATRLGNAANIVENTKQTTQTKQTKQTTKMVQKLDRKPLDAEMLPTYSGQPYVVVNDNVPQFPQGDFTGNSFEAYSDLDDLERCGVAYSNIGTDLMPTEKRGSIGRVKPTGWHTVKYDFVEGKYLYNRCHLIGYQLTAENANKKNLITGTRYLNVEGMLPFENMVADYVKETKNHVLYRVTPVFAGDELVARGVEMEAESVEDEGEGISFHVFVYNVQPGVEIDYATGENRLAEDK